MSEISLLDFLMSSLVFMRAVRSTSSSGQRTFVPDFVGLVRFMILVYPTASKTFTRELKKVRFGVTKP